MWSGAAGGPEREGCGGRGEGEQTYCHAGCYG